MINTTIKISSDTKVSLELLKIHPRQSYDEVIVKLIMENKKWNHTMNL